MSWYIGLTVVFMSGKNILGIYRTSIQQDKKSGEAQRPWYWHATVTTGVVFFLAVMADPGEPSGLVFLACFSGKVGVAVTQILPGWAVGPEEIYHLFWLIFRAKVLKIHAAWVARLILPRDVRIKGERDEKRESMVWWEKYWVLVPALSLAQCATLGTSLLLSGPQFLSEYKMSIRLNQGWQLPSTHTATLCFWSHGQHNWS